MASFKQYTQNDAPEASRPVLDEINGAYGFVPNMLATFAESPAALKGYATLSQIFDGSGLTPEERQVVALAVSAEAGCEYCVAAHSTLAPKAGLSGETIGALRDGEAPADSRLAALRGFALAVVQKRGYVTEVEVDAFIGAGFTKADVLDVILGVTVKTLSNYTNHVTRPPVDKVFEGAKWSKPSCGCTAACST